jgi:hypothetical protein
MSKGGRGTYHEPGSAPTLLVGGRWRTPNKVRGVTRGTCKGPLCIRKTNKILQANPKICLHCTSKLSL